ncbi:uncharacterized protein SPSK_06106 [Sporothrix schenckii 1099-18]|uniref:Tyrosinase copper-binding domain-containing protein n=1 Tax=Sporothrix schenckii 1099-18 TaxID=1397361 RepID=A0A0F2MIH6_SPOSC|nr:uncharacterized protein SPSK_06106 [Sporothrix schenckii 1099-18]KJR89493.1 hypothetical protein SPSK_06106 [Sporothrix schenckii 1099-18]
MKISKQNIVAVLVGIWSTVEAVIVPVTGIHTGINPERGTFPPRLRIQDLQTSGPQWDLYIQAMAAWKSMPEDNELSYFGLSGIHGRPYVAWNGVEQVEGAPLTGYCTHNEVLFAIWHRPMVAVFEQVLARHIQAAAALYNATPSIAETYRHAADTWRHPYWDWALDKALPDAVVTPNVTIRAPPDGRTTATPANPLRYYRFHQFPLNATLFPADDDYHLASFPTTLRCPDPFNNFTSNQGMASANIAGIDLAGQVYNIYTRVADFGSMSSTACDSTSFEQEHNEVHVAVGGIHPMGHFAHLGYSGFDPLFMMHHAAIDRHVALWQAVHANASMFGPQEDYQTQTGQFATAPGTNITADSPLKPFFASANGTFHTPNSARDIATFGYSYPELLTAQLTAQINSINGNRSVNASSRTKLRQAVTAEINRLYAPNSVPATKRRRSRSRTVASTPQTVYFVRIAIEKAGLALPAAVNVFLGTTLAGRLLLLASPPTGRVHGEIGLENTLQISSSQDINVAMEDVLRQRFRWEVATLSETHNVTIQVREETVHLPESTEEFPIYTNVRILDDLGTEKTTEK